MEITLPGRLGERLKTEPKQFADVVTLLKNVESYYGLSPCFFPDYTIHGTDHVNMVLALADRLIPPETLAQLTGRELALLTASIALHDVGMFLTEDGLNGLLAGERSEHQIEGLDQDTWAEAWSAYQRKVRRYSDRELTRAFGESAPIGDVCTDRSKMVRKDYLVCGEFLRQQHPRLAHEIAVYGFPGRADVDVFRDTGFDAEDKNLIGLMARSHGMSLRDTETYLSEQFAEISAPLNVRVFYLMAVLRLADYLDAGQHRAPKILEDRQGIEVPLSQGEWQWNQTIRCENYTWREEKASLLIHASPDTTTLFVKNEAWLRQVQKELDLSWAVLMERYPRAELRLSIHRVESNILNPKTRSTFDRKFLTKEAKLTANPDLSKLLIRPLYGNDPSFGVRELLQNAVDACNEREYLEEKGTYRGKVDICIDTVEKTITVTDNGVGMNEDVLLHYFLSAGSSYRYSDNWLADFAEGRESQVVRSGRFGVGILAAFLLGTEIAVCTRHCRDSIGYTFQFGMEQENIDIQRVKCDVGTTLQVKLSDDTLEELLDEEYNGNIHWFEWYAFQEPAVRYFVDGAELYEERPMIVPRKEEEIPGWLSYQSPYYESIQWRYEREERFYCNGIAIQSMNRWPLGRDTGLSIESPSISVVDKMARAPIDLSRAKFLGLPDEDGFIREIYRYLLAKLLLINWDSAKDKIQNISNTFLPQNGIFGGLSKIHKITYIFSKKGFTLNSETFLQALGIQHWLVFGYEGKRWLSSCDLTQLDAPSVFVMWNRKGENKYIQYISFTSCADTGFRCEELHYWTRLQNFETMKRSLRKYSENKYQEGPVSNGYRRLDSVNATQAPLLTEKMLEMGCFPIIAECRFNPTKEPTVPDEDNLMLHLLREYFGDDIWIPFDMEERKKKFPKAFAELKYYIDKIESGCRW